MNISLVTANRACLSVLLLAIMICSSESFAQTQCSGSQIFQNLNCAGDDTDSDEKALFDLVNKYRIANGRGAIRYSAPLSKVANRRMLDLKQNLKILTHSWSNCKYDIKEEKTWYCVTEAPKRLNSGYGGQGYETLYRTTMGKALPVSALDAWKKSTLHNSIILNMGTFKDLDWEEMGVAIDGQFAALWFGYKGDATGKFDNSNAGLGVSFDQAVKGLTKLLTIDQTSSTIDNNRWQGLSPDRKVRLEIYGTRKELSEANLGLSIMLEPNQTLAPKNKLAVSAFLKNIFPEWA
ncbi:MAG: CAP domain-containing protein, partial [Pyrinomonadaceae bacterium]